MAAGALLLVVVSMAAFAALYTRAGAKESVIMVTSEVASGQAIAASSLKSVEVSAPGVTSVVPSASAGSVVGRTAAVTLLAGTLLTESDVTRGWQPPPGESLVGVGVDPSQLPAAGVTSGEHVDAILVSPPGSPLQGDGGSNAAPGAASATGSAGGAGAGAMATVPLVGTGNALQVGSVLAPDSKVVSAAVPDQSSQTTKTVVSLLVASSLAPELAAASAAGQVALVVVSSAG